MHQNNPPADGVHALPPLETMAASARKLRDTYALKPGAPLYKKEFGYYCLERWREQGMPLSKPLSELFDYDPPAKHNLGQLGWCEAAFKPEFETLVLEKRGDHELVQDFAGRQVLFFTGRRSGFMPEYVDHPVKDQRTWEEHVKWRLAVDAPGRFDFLAERMQEAKLEAAKGMIICQNLIGGYMYLRSLIGPTELLYAFHDQPRLVHDCMQTWLELADAVSMRHQQHVTLDEVFFAEDICYKGGCLISPRMMQEFLFPYYQQYLANTRARQIDRSRHLYVHVDTDGNANPVIPLYREAIGMNMMSPFEVAAGCDVVEIGQRYPDLVMLGGIDKRVLAAGKDAIDQHLERIIPFMRARGGYVPTCDHGVPEEVTLENYFYYRKRVVEMGG